MASSPFMFTVVLIMFKWLLVIPISAYYYARELGDYLDWTTYGYVFTVATMRIINILGSEVT